MRYTIGLHQIFKLIPLMYAALRECEDTNREYCIDIPPVSENTE